MEALCVQQSVPSRKHVCWRELHHSGGMREGRVRKRGGRERERGQRKARGKRKWQGKWDTGEMEREAEKGDQWKWKWVIMHGGNTVHVCLYVVIIYITSFFSDTVACLVQVHPPDCSVKLFTSLLSINTLLFFPISIHLPPAFPCSSFPLLTFSLQSFIIALKQSLFLSMRQLRRMWSKQDSQHAWGRVTSACVYVKMYVSKYLQCSKGEK